MSKEILTFDDIEIENNFATIKVLIFLKDVDIEKMLVSNKSFSSREKNYKHFLGCFYNDHKVKPLHIVLPKTSAYVKSHDGQTK